MFKIEKIDDAYKITEIKDDKSTSKQKKHAYDYKCWFFIWLSTSVVLFLVVGGILIDLSESTLQSTTPTYLNNKLDSIRPISWHILFGIWLMGIGAANCIISLLLWGVDSVFEIKNDRTRVLAKTYYFSPTFSGISEAILYPISFLIGKPEFIGLWLVFKVASRWKGWQEGEEEGAPHKGRLRFCKFIIGNALSIMCSVLIYAAFKIWVL